MANATYTKLKDGTWSIRATSAVKPGDIVKVSKKSGEVKQETVDAVIWNGNGVFLCTISRSATKSTTYRPASNGRYNRRKSCVTGGDCSSFGNGRSCGGHDCDGY